MSPIHTLHHTNHKTSRHIIVTSASLYRAPFFWPRVFSETSLDSETFCSEVTSRRLCSTLLESLLHVRGLGSNGSIGSVGSVGVLRFFGGGWVGIPPFQIWEKKRWGFQCKKITTINSGWNILKYHFFGILDPQNCISWEREKLSSGMKNHPGTLQNVEGEPSPTRKMISNKLKFDAFLNDFPVFPDSYISINEKGRGSNCHISPDNVFIAAKVPRDPQAPSPSHTFDRSSWQAHGNHLHHKSGSWEPHATKNANVEMRVAASGVGAEAVEWSLRHRILTSIRPRCKK